MQKTPSLQLSTVGFAAAQSETRNSGQRSAIKSASTLTRRGLIGAGAAIPVLATAPLAFADSQPAVGVRPHGQGYYRFNIGDFKATVISDGYGNVPFWPIFAANQPASATGSTGSHLGNV